MKLQISKWEEINQDDFFNIIKYNTFYLVTIDDIDYNWFFDENEGIEFYSAEYEKLSWNVKFWIVGLQIEDCDGESEYNISITL